MEQRRGRGRGRGAGRGRGYPNQSYQDFPSNQRRGQRNQSRRNNNNSYTNGYISPQRESFPRTDNAARHEREPVSVQPETVETTSSKQKIKMRTLHPEEMGIELKQKSAVTPFLPRKPENLGTLGRRIRLISNCFKIEIPSGYVYHYDVEIKKQTVNADFEVKTTTDDNANSESVTKTRSDDPSNSDSEAKAKTDDQSNSDSEGRAITGDHKKYRCLNTKTNRRVFQYMIDTVEIFNDLYPAFDGKKNLYTRKELPAVFSKKSPFKCEIVLTNENLCDSNQASQELKQDVYEVKVRPVQKFDTTSCVINLDSVRAFFDGKTDSLPEEAMMAVETILRHTPCLRWTPVGRSFYYSPKYPKPIGGGIEIWFGHHQSTRIGQWKPYVNLDTAATTFLSERPVLDYIADTIGVSTGGLHRIPFIEGNNLKKINHQLRNKEIRVTHLKYRYHIVKLTNVSARDMLIQGKDLSVADYFKQRYEIELKYPNLPCLQVKPERRGIFFPLEVCEFTPGQHYRCELTPSQKSNMIKFTTISPDDRFKEINRIIERTNFNSDKCTQEFNLRVSRTPLEVEGRVLDSPSLIYANEKKVRPRNGTWSMRDAQFLKGGEISHWILIAFRYHANLNKFAELLVNIGESMGIRINNFLGTKIVDMNDNIETLLKEMKKRADLVVVVIPNHKEDKRIYTSIKKAAETLIGLRTQCIKEERLDDMYEDLSPTDNQKGCQIVRNLCLKINAKTDGENYTLLMYEIPKILLKPVIIIGADVSHPSPTETANPDKFKQPSIAACVGSLDSFCKRFAAAVRPQPKTKETSRTEEIIGDLENMIMELLKAFYRHTKGQKPENIIVYRDGVSEGEFTAVKNREVLSIRNACNRLQVDYEPPITCIVVQKRHHIRFKTKDPRDAIKGNVPAGTVADTVVTHRLNYDYLLYGQPGMKGTSRPSYYTVIHDDNDFSANDLQKMTYQFCHMYVRCTKSISIPAPVAYAHLVAYRARRYLHGLSSNVFSTNNNSSAIHTPTLQDIYEKISVLDNFKGSMYFV